MRQVRILIPLVWLAAALVLRATAGVAGGASDTRASRVAVAIENYEFQPDPITVAVGSTVVWTNRDEVNHNVVSKDRLFSSPELEPGHHFEFTFQKSGRFDYFCSLHPEMKGRVIVE